MRGRGGDVGEQMGCAVEKNNATKCEERRTAGGGGGKALQRCGDAAEEVGRQERIASFIHSKTQKRDFIFYFFLPSTQFFLHNRGVC